MLSNRSCRRCRKPPVVFQAAIELSPRGDGAGETRDHLRRDPPIFLWGAFPAVGGCGPGLNTRPAIDPPPWTKLIEPLSAAFLFVWEMPVSSCLLTEVTMPLMLNGAHWVVGYYVIECNPFISTSEISQAEPHRYYQPTTTHLTKQFKRNIPSTRGKPYKQPEEFITSRPRTNNMDTNLSEQADPVTMNEDKNNHQADSNQVTTYNPQVVLISGAIGLLLLFIRIGPFSFILVIIVSFTLSALPDFRSIVDSTLGTTLSTERRLAETFPALGAQSQSRHLLTNLDSSSNYHHQLNQNLVKLDQLPEQLQSAFGSLFDLIIRDYIESWYLLPSVSTGDRAFLNQLRNGLNHILLKAHAKLTTKSSKETMIYLIGCLSMNLVRELNDRADSKSQTSSQDRIAQRLTQTRRISEEILLTLGSSSITSSPLTLNLVSEVLTVQLISITSSYNQDWFNQTLIDSLGTGTPTQASLASTTPAKATNGAVTAAVVDQIKENTKQNDPHRSIFQSLSPARSHSANDAPSTMAVTPDDIQSVTGNDVLIAYLKSPANFNLSISTKPNGSVRLQDFFEHTPKWAPLDVITDFERSSLLSPSSNDSVQVECFVKLFNHFDSFHKTCQSANLKSDVVKIDAISVLSALAPLMDYAVDQHISSQPDQNSKVHISSTWKSAIIETLRRLELVSSSGSPVFGNLQDWILDRLRSIKSNQSNQASVTSKPASSADIDYQPWSTSPNETTRGDKIHYMTLPNIPSTGSGGYTVDSPPMQSQDLASSRDEHTWDKAKNSTTEAILDRHRAPSVSRAVTSPPAGFRVSPQRNSGHEGFGSPTTTLHSATFSQSSPFSARVPEEGDMTEGYSLDEASENEGSDPDQSSQSINPYHSTGSTSTTRFDDTNTLTSPISRSNSMNTPPVSHSSHPASFSVSVTDMSPPSATDPKTGLIKQKKDISLLIAVEAPSVPGFIVTRGWPELERMDLAINKKKLVGVGTKAFPRALLPTNLNFKTIDHVRRELEAYLKCLLSDERYSKSEPVLKFFAKERSGMSGRGGAINNIFNTTSSTLDSFGKGVASVGKEVVSKPVDFATLGLNRLSKGVFSGLPFGNSPVTNEESTSSEIGNHRDSLQFPHSTNSNLGSSDPTDQSTKVTEGFVNNKSTVDAHQTGGNGELVDDSQTGPKEDKTEEQSAVPKRNRESIPSSRPTSDGSLLSAAPQTRDENNSTFNASSQDVESTTNPQQSASVDGTTSKNQEPLVGSNLPETSKPPTTPGNNSKSTAPLNGTGNTLPGSSATATTTLSGKEFDTVIIGLISILEAAYGLDQRQGGSGNNTPWSMKRGVLRVLETILRTTSFSHFIRLTLSQIIDKFEKVETYVDLINSALLSLSSSTKEEAGTAPDEERQSFKNKRKLRPQKSLGSLVSSEDDSLDDLSLDLCSSPSASSSSAATQPQQQYQYQSLGDDEEDKKAKKLRQNKRDRVAEIKAQRKEAARKLFVESWSNLKIGLGSNATDLAATKVFDLFQEFEDSNSQADDEDEDSSSGQSKADQSARKALQGPSGIEFIVHSLLLDLIRIILLL
ncbi:uncharacterized protein PGTG_09004 [Puccinia graminis f. sp. tritici CRL 75-36-700-3]|uniref:PXA domain-containing protein n=1 Tax=Puccinia graminis f. sp. tritici (strain CRL 75-36-700-3 / race SCCL) TaxID=418459 RepID=E3KE70_PUCGT|nr:uncharacterized protein PGTG_09004 [Puccinia graminis f. sp. tritici CRL 75-36-700-3]EFP82808.2 hypothetical protein PGTG_09004 [Puccinia graminis f. sp. tritici CRL 75-36-700-3]